MVFLFAAPLNVLRHGQAAFPLSKPQLTGVVGHRKCCWGVIATTSLLTCGRAAASWPSSSEPSRCFLQRWILAARSASVACTPTPSAKLSQSLLDAADGAGDYSADHALAGHADRQCLAGNIHYCPCCTLLWLHDLPFSSSVRMRAGLQGDAQRSAGRVAESAVQLLEKGESASLEGRAVAAGWAWLNSNCIAGVPHAQRCWNRPHERFSDVRS